MPSPKPKIYYTKFIAMSMNHNPEENIAKNLEKIKHKIVVMSGKGGVGKSTVATNLAVTLSAEGKEVGLLDIDIHGPNIPKMLGIEEEKIGGDEKSMYPVMVSPHLKVISMGFLLKDKDTPVIWRGPLKMKAIKQFIGDVEWGNLDYLVVDLPPGTGDEPLSIAQLIPKGMALIVTTPQDVALLDSRKAVMFAKTLNMPVLGIVENMSGFTCPHCGKEIDLFKVGGGKKSAEELGVPFLGAIPIDGRIVESGDSGKPFVLNKDTKASEAFASVVKKIEEIVEQKSG